MPTNRMKRKRRLFRVASASVSLLLIGLLLFVNGCTGWLTQAILWGPNTGRLIDPAEDPQPEVLQTVGIDQQLRVDVGPPAASLSIWVINPPTVPRGTVICLHGINSTKTQSVAMGKLLADSGYRAVLVDLRSHGYSSGNWITFGVVESNDLVQVADALEQRGLMVPPLGVYGTSYGASIGIQYAAIDPRVRAVVAATPFASLRDVTPGMVRIYGPKWLTFFLTDSAIQRAITDAGVQGSFDPDRADAVTAIQRTTAQVLLMHGDHDRHIRPTHSQRLHAAAQSHSKLIIFRDRNHASLLGDPKMRMTAKNWFETWLTRPTSQPTTMPTTTPSTAPRL